MCATRSRSSKTCCLRVELAQIISVLVVVVQELAPVSLDAEWAERIRGVLTSVLVALVRHRQRGADLVYEAYAVDIGGGF